MCGIAGLLGRRVAGFAGAVGGRLSHRGPDGAGQWAEASATLVHCRLAIQDPSPAGDQPMRSACGRYVITFNGEIYNHHALRRSLIDAGEPQRSASDTEIVLGLFARHGPGCLTQLRGMYAFCIWDRDTATAFLARDPLGIKPLYLWHGSDGALAFASEVRALLASGIVPRRLDPVAVGRYLQAGCLPRHRTLADGVVPLEPGHYGIWRAGSWRSTRFWRPDFRHRAAANADQLRQALQDSIADHLVSDVPVALSLSGGLDSAAVLALCGRAVPTLTIGFAEAAFDESERAAEIAAAFGAPHRRLAIDRPTARSWLPCYLAAMDQPSIDGFNVFCVARLAREEGYKVLLSGLGGDELFGGYPSFAEVPRLRRTRHRLGDRAASLAAPLARRDDEGSQRLAALLSGGVGLAATHRLYRAVFTPAEASRIMAFWGLADIPWDDALPDDPAEDDRFPTDLDRLAWLEATEFLGNRLLRDADGFAMAAGVELRVPLADATLVDRLSSYPADRRLATGKAMLVEAVPELSRWAGAPKRGFDFPFQPWLSGTQGDFLPAVPPVPEELDLRSWYRRWSLMALDHWLAEHLDCRLTPAGHA
jgi:asparagine synthase (glutamine-hydrolysing)